MEEVMLPLQASYDRGYETAAQEYAYMHEGFVQRQQVFYDNLRGETLNEVQAKFPAAGQLGNEATAAETQLVSSEATAAEIPLVSSEATAHLPFTIGGVVA